MLTTLPVPITSYRRAWYLEQTAWTVPVEHFFIQTSRASYGIAFVTVEKMIERGQSIVRAWIVRVEGLVIVGRDCRGLNGGAFVLLRDERCCEVGACARVMRVWERGGHA